MSKTIIISIIILALVLSGCLEEQNGEPYCGSSCHLCKMYNMQYNDESWIKDCVYTSCINGTEKVVIKTCQSATDNSDVAGAIIIHGLLS